MKILNKIIKPAVLGLGYVGLPIFLRLSQKFETVGFDLNKTRIKNLSAKKDLNKEFSKKDLNLKNQSFFSNNYMSLKNSNFFC